MRDASTEKRFEPISGWLMLFLLPAVLIAMVVMMVTGAWYESPALMITFIVVVLADLVMMVGFFIVNPNMARVLVLFGRYRGSVLKDGFYWTNPFTVRKTISLKAHNLASQTIKVNDLAGNPIEIGAVVVWQVRETAQAMFDVENYHHYVDVQIETAVRQLAKSHPYDENAMETGVATLRGDTEAVTDELQEELQKRLNRAGIEVLEARISHLAYAPEIASAMLQRQQAAAVVAAREKIVEGAVGMVRHALEDLSEQKIVELDDERRATMVGNLLVVLCGQHSPQPVLNTGSLYT